MRIDIITCVPAMFSGTIDQSILKRAGDKGIAQIHVHDLRDYAINKHNQIDDYAFGGGAGMVLMIEPIDKCISQLKSERKYDEIIYMSPDGEKLSQSISNELSLNENIILLCGHYKGIDERVREHLITREISIGDYVLTGGELAAAVVADSVIRLLPGVMNDETSALTDSFQDDLIAPPVYTRPAEYNNWKVPAVLTSGHQAKIDAWRFDQQVERTKAKRPDLLKDSELED
ncbi:tRNA (guanosine(37)-N1)-methyltransferase TrmD [Reichenbachiella carrageenanivorans]|uniref:tRNA (guanine-N(1)-)-methyltransferase n=1 Tax=Reichenbachiella carrageenanivorans TaxID=2979869 RepID=A0ABY6DA66_9BACT|nr:tRNA (guanosine(37)-N1)-methyltransferase TrmD [Reichenbachiella carrageenanivorans]UXX80765.1 tRNA (guanosine(37)-N1)-methyltransferase TrmD [Reichenbachiella carrageenanivorans]